MPEIFLTAQNFDIYDGDSLDLFARTGSSSIEQIANAGAEGVILGHPEASDTPSIVKQKLQTIVNRAEVLPSSFDNKITLMAGETWEDFQSHKPDKIAEIITQQLLDILSVVPQTYLPNCTIGYDPKWGSKGAGHDDAPPPEPELIFKVSKSIREMLIDEYGNDIGSNVPMIYGGRSTPVRTLEILADPNINGLILGSACNTVAKTKDIAEAMIKAKPTGKKVLHANFKAFNLTDSYDDYVTMLRQLSDDFIVYISPCHADLRQVAKALA